MRRENVSSAPDFTNAALIMGLVNLLWIFMVLWALFGLPVILVMGYVLDKLITRFNRRA